MELLLENIEGDSFDKLTRLKQKCELMMQKDGQNVTDEQKRNVIEIFESSQDSE